MGVRIKLGTAAAGVAALLAAAPAQAAFPGQNGKIVFQSARDGGVNAQEIYSMNPDGSAQTRLTDSDGSNGIARWSPDGLKIMFGSSRDPAGTYLMNADGSGQTRVTIPGDAQWSPDGTKIAYAQSSLNGFMLTVANADGTEPQVLTTGGNNPAWSPDGTQLAFDKHVDVDDIHIATIDVDGTDEAVLTAGRFPTGRRTGRRSRSRGWPRTRRSTS